MAALKIDSVELVTDRQMNPDAAHEWAHRFASELGARLAASDGRAIHIGRVAVEAPAAVLSATRQFGALAHATAAAISRRLEQSSDGAGTPAPAPRDGGA